MNEYEATALKEFEEYARDKNSQLLNDAQKAIDIDRPKQIPARAEILKFFGRIAIFPINIFWLSTTVRRLAGDGPDEFAVFVPFAIFLFFLPIVGLFVTLNANITACVIFAITIFLTNLYSTIYEFFLYKLNNPQIK